MQKVSQKSRPLSSYALSARETSAGRRGGWLARTLPRQVLRPHQQTNRPCGAGRPFDESVALQDLDHVVNGWRGNLEITLQIGFRRRLAVDLRIVIDECPEPLPIRFRTALPAGIPSFPRSPHITPTGSDGML
jgi:hypothetical protein